MNMVINTIISCVTYPPTHSFLYPRRPQPRGGKAADGTPAG